MVRVVGQHRRDGTANGRVGVDSIGEMLKPPPDLDQPMTRPLLSLLTLALAFAGGCNRPAVVTVLGDYGSQPATEVTPLDGGVMADAEPGIDSARRAVAPYVESIWPEPISATERPGQWDVVFKYREKRVSVDGVQSVRAQEPSTVLVVVSKPDLAAKVVPGR